MNNHSEESNEREHKISEDNNTNIDQSDRPTELFIENNDDEICNSKNENETSKDKKKQQNIEPLYRYENKEIITKTTVSCILTYILFLLIFSIYALISIIDIAFQIINPNGLNTYLIDDLLLFFLLPILFGAFIFSDRYMKNPKILQVIVSSIIFIIFIGSFIANNIIFFKYFFEKNKSPNYIKYFYLSYIIIKFSDLGLGIIFLIIISCHLLIIPKEKRKEEINAFQTSPGPFLVKFLN